MARVCAARQEVKAELPNILLSTTYALNKSNTKRVCVGLEYSAGYYHEVIKIISSGGNHRTTTLDENTWLLFKNQFETISSYFDEDYSFYRNFGRPSKIFLPHHDVDFTTSYGVKSISIEERPKNIEIIDDVEDEEGEQQAEQLCKRRKTFNIPPGIVMQQSTFDGLRNQSAVIDLRLKCLKEIVGKVNRTTDYILEYLKKKFDEEKNNEEGKKKILNDFKTFKQFYSIHKSDIENFITDRMIDDSDYYKSLYLKIVLQEMYMFDLPFIVKDLRDYMIRT